MKIACVCIAKNEDNYIEEWVKYHSKLGFDNIILYQNNWRTTLDHPSLIKIEFDSDRGDRQIYCYANFVYNYKTEYDYAAFFDVDEFLVLKKHHNIKSFMQDHKEFEAVCFKWFYFGNNEHAKVENNNYSVLQRFTKRGKDPDVVGKYIVRLENASCLKVHHPNCNCLEIETSVAQLNHYYSKTREEFEVKRHNRVDDGFIGDLQYERGNHNEVEDRLAYEFFIDK